MSFHQKVLFSLISSRGHFSNKSFQWYVISSPNFFINRSFPQLFHPQVISSTCNFTHGSFCQLSISLTYPFPNRLFHMLVISSTSHFNGLSFHFIYRSHNQLFHSQVISSARHFINRSYNQLFHPQIISSTCHFIHLSFCKLVISSTCPFINYLTMNFEIPHKDIRQNNIMLNATTSYARNGAPCISIN